MCHLISRMSLEQRCCLRFTGDKTDTRRSDLPKTVLLVSGDARMWITSICLLPTSISWCSSTHVLCPQHEHFWQTASVFWDNLSSSSSVVTCFPFYGVTRTWQESNSRSSESSKMPGALSAAFREESENLGDTSRVCWSPEIHLGRGGRAGRSREERLDSAGGTGIYFSSLHFELPKP